MKIGEQIQNIIILRDYTQWLDNDKII